MPHQQRIYDVAFEIDPETGVFAYREVIVTMMRQSGKTVLILPVELDRCLMWHERQRVIYTAQTGSDAREKLLTDQVPVIEASPMGSLVRQVYRAKGEESIRFKNGSSIELAASSKDAGHGFTVDVGVLDECWADEDDRREQAILPAMITRPWAQVWVTSTQGTDESTYLNRKTELGRAAALADKGSGIAYFEWSVPEDADIENPEVWWEYMPALGWTIQPIAVAHALQTMEEMEWRRAFGNQRTRGMFERIIPDTQWAAVQSPIVEVPQAPGVVFGLDVHPERASAAICASDGKTVELIDFRPGTGWVRERVAALRDKYSGVFVIDGGGPALSVALDLEQDGAELHKLGNAEVAASCARMYDAIADMNVTFRSNEVFDIAVSGLAKRPVGDRFVWARQVSTTDITPFVAATLAYDGAALAEQVQAAIY